MTKDEIKAEFDAFMEFPAGSDGKYVTTTSCLIFAEVVANMAVAKERERCAKVCESMWCDGGDANDFAQAIRETPC